MTVVAIVFWVAIGLLVYTQVGYALLLALFAALVGSRQSHGATTAWSGELPQVTAVVAAYNEQDVIAQRIANLRSLDYPPQRLQVIVASDGSTDRRPRARAPPAPTSCWSSRAAARSAPRTPPWPRRPASCSRSPTPTRSGSPTR